MNIGDAVLPSIRYTHLAIRLDSSLDGPESFPWNTKGIGLVLQVRPSMDKTTKQWVQLLTPDGIGWCFNIELRCAWPR